MLAFLEKIAKREGEIPRILGEGVRIAGAKLGISDPLHVNVAVVPAHDPRAFLSTAVATATSMNGVSLLHHPSSPFPTPNTSNSPAPKAASKR
jgi:aldehyde:ferredoxin oxidoreductase